MVALEQKLNYTFRNRALLENALRHSSYANESRDPAITSNERLEFLGDSVLGFVTAKYLYTQVPDDRIPALREFQQIAAFAYAVAEQNAYNGTVVTAPTCGACGVLPAVLYYFKDKRNLSDLDIAHALGVAGLFGELAKRNASVSGAECGCQAEVGVACSMAAAAVCQAFGYNIHQIEYAAEVSLEHHLGLTCDPICGLVQVPCIERNAVAAMRAINSANIAYFLTGTRNISYDMVLKSMYYTGLDMNQRYRETAEGGLARIYTRRGK